MLRTEIIVCITLLSHVSKYHLLNPFTYLQMFDKFLEY